MEILKSTIMTKKLLKQVVGIDIAHKEIDVYLGNMDQEAATHLYAYKTFKNNEKKRKLYGNKII